jgi:hypothetical protein
VSRTSAVIGVVFFFIYCTCLLAVVTIFLRNKILAALGRQTHIPFPRENHGTEKFNSHSWEAVPFVIWLRWSWSYIAETSESHYRNDLLFLPTCFSFLTPLPRFFCQWPIILFRRQLSCKWKNWRVKRGWSKGRSGRWRGRFLCLEDGPPCSPFILNFISFSAKEIACALLDWQGDYEATQAVRQAKRPHSYWFVSAIISRGPQCYCSRVFCKLSWLGLRWRKNSVSTVHNDWETAIIHLMASCW